MDRFQLFDHMSKLFESIDRRHKKIVCDGVEFDLLDVTISTLYLTAVREQYGQYGDLIKFNSLSPINKVKSFNKYLYRRIAYTYNDLEKKKISRLDNKACKADVLFIPVEPTHLSQQLPVVEELIKTTNSYVFLTNRPKIYKELDSKKYSVLFFNLDFNKESLSIEKKVSSLCRKIRSTNLEYGSVIIDRNIIEKVTNSIEDTFVRTIKIMDSLVKYLKEIKPKIVVVGNDFTIEGRIAVRACQQLGIDTACIMHGSVFGEPMDKLHIVDKYFAHGEKPKDHLVKIGISSNNIIVSGDPKIDKLSFSPRSIHHGIKQGLNLKKGEKFIMLALSGVGHCTSTKHFDKIVTSALRFSQRYPEIKIMAKLHRKDNKKNYLYLMKLFSNSGLKVVTYGQHGYPLDIYDWLNGCRLVITGASTVAIEAMLMSVPVVTVDYMSEYHDVDFIECGATIHVDREQNFNRTINDALHSPDKFSNIQLKAREYVDSYFYKRDGNSSKRIVNHLIT